MKMTWPVVAALLAVVLLGCPPDNGVDSGRKDGGDGGDAGPAQTPYNYFSLDPAGSELKHLSMAVTADDRVGVAYFVSVDGGVNAQLLNPNDAGSGGATVLQNYEVRYVEYRDGLVSTPQKVATVQLVHGLSVAFQANGEPAVAYLGGQSDLSVYWLQSDAVVSYRSGGSSWTQYTSGRLGSENNCGSTVSDRGFLVGLNPALVFNGSTAYHAFRNGHDGQFPQQDWAASDLDVNVGGPTAWTKGHALCGGDNKIGYGAHISMVMAGAQPAMASDRVLGSPDGFGQDVFFQKRKTDGTWTVPLDVMANGNNQSGPSLAYDSQVGYGIAAVERSTNLLRYTFSLTGEAGWSDPDPVFQTGSGGWYPSLAFDPIFHEPAIAFYICSARNGVNESSCQASEDSLHVRQLTAGGDWQDQLVDEEGGYLPKLGYLTSGKRVVAYRLPATGAMRLAVEK
ncbi:MAG: hypothetical protein ACYC8T_16625 [Myxococcaceae bacterium]